MHGNDDYSATFAIFASDLEHARSESHIHRIYDIRFLQVVIKLARLKNQSTMQLGNHQPRNVGDDPSCWIEGFWRGRMTTLGELTLLFCPL